MVLRPITISLFLLFGGVHSFGQLSPISLTAASFDNDLIAESGSNPLAVTSIAFDGPAKNILYSNAFRVANPIITAGGLPDAGTIINGTDTWQLASYSANNCLFFPAQTVVSSKSLFLTTPYKYQQISLLGACGFGNISVNITLHFTNNSTSGYGPFTINDWFSGTPFVVGSLGRIVRNTTVSAQTGTPTNPRLYQLNIILTAADQIKNVDRIDIQDNSTNNTTSVGFFAASAKFSLLPLDISSLKAAYQPMKKNVLLTWEAENTLNTQNYVIQRSDNGVDFIDIAQMTVEKSSGRSKYAYNDFRIRNGQTLFYRLKEVLLDGSILYTNTASIKTSEISSMRIFQSLGKIYVLDNDQSPLQCEIINMEGKIIMKETIHPAFSISIDLQPLAKGVYVLYLQNDHQNKGFKFIK